MSIRPVDAQSTINAMTNQNVSQQHLSQMQAASHNSITNIKKNQEVKNETVNNTEKADKINAYNEKEENEKKKKKFLNYKQGKDGKPKTDTEDEENDEVSEEKIEEEIHHIDYKA